MSTLLDLKYFNNRKRNGIYVKAKITKRNQSRNTEFGLFKSKKNMSPQNLKNNRIDFLKQVWIRFGPERDFFKTNDISDGHCRSKQIRKFTNTKCSQKM